MFVYSKVSFEMHYTAVAAALRVVAHQFQMIAMIIAFNRWQMAVSKFDDDGFACVCVSVYQAGNFSILF